MDKQEKAIQHQADRVIKQIEETTVKKYLDRILVNPAALAKSFHDEYLKQSKKYGWNVQEGTQGEFKDLPEVNRMVMVYTCEALMRKHYYIIPKKEIQL